MTKRSESNAVGNNKFKDLPLSNYPAKIDSSKAGDAGYNPNMKGFLNVGDPALGKGERPDYVYAEHINALIDSVLSIQRILGINPHINMWGQNADGTVSDRIEIVENMEEYYDKRYGGENWSPELGQTILTHTHGGGPHQAPQINLETDVKGKLGRENINTDSNSTSGLTGADIKVGPGRKETLSEGMEDRLSKADGGVVIGLVEFTGPLKTNTSLELTAKHTSNQTPLATDATSTDGSVRKSVGLAEANVITEDVSFLYPGKYAFGVRYRTSAVSGDQVRISYKEGEKVQEIILTEKERKKAGWNMGYLVFEKTTNKETKATVHVDRMKSEASQTLDVDNIFIAPAHPAIFDK